VTAASDKPEASQSAGLCERCIHSKKIVSDRASVFWQCALSSSDPRFPKYPRLPVLSCAGFKLDAKSQ